MAIESIGIRMVFHRLAADNENEFDSTFEEHNVISDLDCALLNIECQSPNDGWDNTALLIFLRTFALPLNKGIMLRCDDPFMIELLEPKNGATIHDFWTDLRFNNDPTYAELLGTEFIANTKNGFRVLIVNPQIPVGPVGIAEYLLRKGQGNIVSVKITDDTNSSISMEYSNLSS